LVLPGRQRVKPHPPDALTTVGLTMTVRIDGVHIDGVHSRFAGSAPDDCRQLLIRVPE
jgi:hypothetical protein